MATGWTPDLSVGVEAIDKQHIIWFEKANQLFEAGKSGKARDFISQMLAFLDDYTKLHFRDEEKYMQQINYPEYQVQKKLHTDFIAKLDKLKKDYEQSGGNIVVIINANQMVVDWLVQHISTQDKKIGVYAKSLKH
ncbi:hemerythrin [Hydrogenoanaerobacterium saccharovorans]|uniref:Hemerythrin n=1 Tax=Hydrogenoanaerobacterium saccharovorans TaxID=474960 RepID=A0A1H8DG23_9FIRM|nr:bacteriohemerythrin [Hydrogenoanaerobacterium saccharovorans]RPF42188.1 hemerythrin [Hydrogenoanaerobacterium saccharovorans]SEN06116.1 hemerythrin [Hydrogenoanaerobacterium saccharovorans]